MSFANATPFAAIDAPILDRNGREVVLVIVKATFKVVDVETVALADEQSPVRLVEVLTNPKASPDDPRVSARYPSDLCLEKRGADVVVVGDAVAKKPVTSVDVGIQLRQRTVPMRVHGMREYFRHIFEIAISAAVPFERMPITWERAYGGASEDWTVVETRNPAGVGVAKSDGALVGKLAPQVEHPSYPHKNSRDRHPPVGCGPILPHWSPRREQAGTFDGAWKASRMPLLPLDFDVRHNNVAHPSLVVEEGLRARDPVSVLGMTHDLFAFELPKLPVVLRARYDDRTDEARPAVDTLILEPTKKQLEMVVRKAFPIGRGKTALRELSCDVEQ
jgi:hypothetical protein